MRKLKFFTVLIIVSIIIVGCSSGGTNEGLNKKEVLEKVEAQYKDLKSTSAEAELAIENVVNNASQMITQTIDTKFLYGTEGTITHIHTKQKNVNADNSELNVEFYKTPEGAYLNDGMLWQKYAGAENYNTTYKPLVESLKEASDKMDMKEEDDHYVFIFKGKDASVYNAVKNPFTINFQGLEPDVIDLDVSYKIKKDTMYLDDVFIGASNLRDEANKSSIEGKIKFFDFNETDDIEIPPEAKN